MKPRVFEVLQPIWKLKNGERLTQSGEVKLG